MSLGYFPHYQWALLLGVSVLAWCFGWVRPRFGVPASLLLGYLSLSSVWVWVWVENRYITVNPYDQMALRYFSADSFARLFALVVPLMLLSEKRMEFKKTGELLAWAFVLINSLLVLLAHLVTGCREANQCGGVGNPSIMVGMSVCLLPVVIQSWGKQFPLLLLVLAAVYASKSSVALGLLTLYFLYCLAVRARRYLWMGVIPAVLPLIAGHFFLGDKLLDSSDRFMVWRFMMQKWATPWNQLMGTGWGTYHVFSINLQATGNLAAGSHWNTMHNDWLQMVFEGGYLGALLAVLTYASALWKLLSRSEWAVLGSALLYGIYMGANPALHQAIPAFFGAWIFLYALRKPKKSEGDILCVS